MAEKIKRSTGEFWTFYLVRRLKLEGVQVPDWTYSIPDNGFLISLKTQNGIGATILNRNPCRYGRYNDAICIDVLPESREIDFYLAFNFDEEMCNIFADFSEEEGRLAKNIFPFIDDGSISSEKVIESVISYLKGLAENPGLVYQKEEDLEQKKLETDDSRKLDEILGSVRRLEMLASEHPMVLKPDDVYLRELYTRKINQKTGNLRVLRYKGRTIPYVLVGSDEIEGNVGRVSDNLYFVAADKAPEKWQQEIVAYHESWCSKIGHDKARKREIGLARKLGKEQEYLAWRATIDNGKIA